MRRLTLPLVLALLATPLLAMPDDARTSLDKARAALARHAADAVDEELGLVWEVVVDNVVKERDVEAASGDWVALLDADNVSSGLEPVFSFTYTRKVLMPDGSRKEVTDQPGQGETVILEVPA